MRISVIAWVGNGDVPPMLALAAGLREADHAVTAAVLGDLVCAEGGVGRAVKRIDSIYDIFSVGFHGEGKLADSSSGMF